MCVSVSVCVCEVEPSVASSTGIINGTGSSPGKTQILHSMYGKHVKMLRRCVACIVKQCLT